MDGSAAIDFFVSYTSPDVAWAEWIAWHLEQDGFTTTIQAWDFRPGHNFAVAMQDATVNAERTIAVISPAFFASPYTNAEWAVAFSEDPDGSKARFVPVRVRACKPPGLHKGIVYIDLVGLDEPMARLRLLNGVRSGRSKPKKAPIFPGGAPLALDAPRYPGEAPPIWNVPSSTRIFEGRGRALAKLAGELAEDGRAAVTQAYAVHGLGGVGKTQLAARFAHEHRAEYDIVWWVRAEQDATRLADYAALATRLELPEAAEGDQASQVTSTKAWLERSGRWLLIFDNAPDPDSIARLLPDGGEGHVLITSRRHADWRALGASPLKLDVWERQESIDFLARSTGSDDHDAADEIAEFLGDLPLALSQAAAYTNEQAISLRTCHSRLVERAGNLLSKGKPLDYGDTVSTTWDLAFDQVSASQPIERLLAVCAYLGPERIPRELLALHTEPSPQPTSEILTENMVEDMIQTLLNYALLTPADEETLDMHRVVQHVVRERQTLDAQQASAKLALTLVSSAFPSQVKDPKAWRQCDRLLPHALVVVEHVQALDSGSLEIAKTLTKCAIFLDARGDYPQARDLLLWVLQVKEKAYGPDHPEVAGALCNLSNLLRELDEAPAARDALERALRIEENAYGPAHLDIAITLSNLGNTLNQLGDLPAALEAQARSLRINEDAYGPNHPEVAKSLTNLGIVLLGLEELPAARDAQERALHIKEDAYGTDHPEIAMTLGNLGNVLQSLHELPAARDAQERALHIEERAYGPDHPEVARTLTNLGAVRLELGELAAARDAHERALQIKERAYGPNHPEVAITLGNLANVLDEFGETHAARGALQRSLAIFTESYGPTHPLTQQAARHLDALTG